MGTLKTKKIDYLPTTEGVTDPETKKVIDDLTTIIAKFQKDVHNDLRDHEDRLIALEP